MRKTHLLIIAVLLFGIFGDLYFRDFARVVGLTVTALFIVFLFVHSWMDKRGMLLPKKKD